MDANAYKMLHKKIKIMHHEGDSREVQQIGNKIQIKSKTPFILQNQGHSEVARRLLDPNTSKDSNIENRRVIVQPAIPNSIQMRRPAAQVINIPHIPNDRVRGLTAPQTQVVQHKIQFKSPAENPQRFVIFRNPQINPVAINAPNATPIRIMAPNSNYRYIRPTSTATISSLHLSNLQNAARFQNTNTYFTLNTSPAALTTMSTPKVVFANSSITVQNTVANPQMFVPAQVSPVASIDENVTINFEDLEFEEAEVDSGQEVEEFEDQEDSVTIVDEIEEITSETTHQGSDSDSDIAKQYGLTPAVSILPKKVTTPNVTIVKDQTIKLPFKYQSFHNPGNSQNSSDNQNLVKYYYPAEVEIAAPPPLQPIPSTSKTPSPFKLPLNTNTQNLASHKSYRMQNRSSSVDHPAKESQTLPPPTGLRTVRVPFKSRSSSMYLESADQLSTVKQNSSDMRINLLNSNAAKQLEVQIVNLPPRNEIPIVLRRPSTHQQSPEKQNKIPNKPGLAALRNSLIRKSLHAQEEQDRSIAHQKVVQEQSDTAQKMVSNIQKQSALVRRVMRKSIHAQEKPVQKNPEQTQDQNKTVLIRHAQLQKSVNSQVNQSKSQVSSCEPDSTSSSETQSQVPDAPVFVPVVFDLCDSEKNIPENSESNGNQMEVSNKSQDPETKKLKVTSAFRNDSPILSHLITVDRSKPETSSDLLVAPPQKKKRNTNVSPNREDPDEDEWSAVEHFHWDEGTGQVNASANVSICFNEFGFLELPKQKELEFLQLKSAANQNKPDNYGIRDLSLGPDTLQCRFCNGIDLLKNFYSPDHCSVYCSRNGKINSPTNSVKSLLEINENFVVSPVRNEVPMPMQTSRREDSKTHQKLLSEIKKGKKRRNSEPTDNLVEKEFKSPCIFSWEEYLGGTYIKAPHKLFKTPFPAHPNLFKKNMKLEAIDPENQSLFCVCTVVEVSGFRIKLHFDGYSEEYDFWENADSPNIFPPGFCAKTKRILQVPPSREDNFNWVLYLTEKECTAAPKYIFFQLEALNNTRNIPIGSKLEVFDNKWTKKLKIGTIADVLGDRILIHFDGHELSSSLWYPLDSPHLHPRDYHKKFDIEIEVEPHSDLYEFYVPDRQHFDWRRFLEQTRSIALPANILKPRKQKQFKTGMKIEIVDKVTPSLVRPATILKLNYFSIKVLYDGFDQAYAYSVDDDDSNIHPVDWCKRTGHKIEFPASFMNHNFKACKFPGCRGIGGFVNGRLAFAHTTLQECPLSRKNWNKYLNYKKEPPRVSDRSISKKYDSACNYSPINVDPSTSGQEWSKNIPIEEKYKCIINESHLNDISQNIETAQRLFSDQSKQDLTILQCLMAKNPYKWTISEVKEYVSSLVMPNNVHGQKFEDNEIDGACFLELTLDDLIKRLGIPFGNSMIINFWIATLRNEFILAVSKS